MSHFSTVDFRAEPIWKSMYDPIAHIVKECGSRAPCSKEEKKAAQWIEAKIKPFCDEVHTETFECHPRSFDGWPRFSVVMALIAIAIFLTSLIGIHPIAGRGLSLAWIVFLFYAIWRQFFNYEEFIHRIFPYYKAQSQNVYGVFHAQQPPKRRIIFAAHYDSSFRFNLIQWTNVGYSFFIIGGVTTLIIFTVTVVFSLIAAIWLVELIILLQLLKWVIILANPIFLFVIFVVGKSPKMMFGALASPSKKASAIFILVGIYALILSISLYSWLSSNFSFENLVIFTLLVNLPHLIALFLFLGRDAVVGALDNLSAVGVVFGIADLIKNLNQDQRQKLLQETEIMILFTGAEEAGDRGAEAFSKLHAPEYNKIDTMVVNLESLTDSALQKIVVEEKTTRTKCDPRIYKLLGKAAEEMGIVYQFQALPEIAGGTDCAGFAKGGLAVSGLEGIRYSDYLQWYHSDRDNLDLINQDVRPDEDNGNDYKTLNVRGSMTNALKICAKYIDLCINEEKKN
jgi:hypothetical protein